MSKKPKRIIIVGYNQHAKRFAEKYSSNYENRCIDGYFEDFHQVNELSELPIIGNIDECIDYAIDHQIQEIYSTISPDSNTIYEMTKKAEKSMIRFKFIPDSKVQVSRNTHVEYFGDIRVLTLRTEPLEEYSNRIKKRIFDTLFSLIVIIFLLSWLLPILAILIKINSRGPVFFKQPRSGKYNRQFTCYKLRTLSVNEESHIRQVTLNDSRVSRLGRFLRKTNLDELPQFFNVLLGNMSVIGPRPHMLLHTHNYSKIMNEYMVRHFMKPGISGWAQVNGFRGEIKDDDQLRNRIYYDIWYMENWSLWLDLRIVWKTINSTFKGDKNAY